MTDIERRIMTFPMKARGADVRGSRTGYYVTTVSEGMNDRDEYARLFASAPKLLVALRSLSNVVEEAKHSGFLNENYDSDRLDGALTRAKTAIANATKNWN